MSFFDAYSPFQRLLGKKKTILYSSLPLQPNNKHRRKHWHIRQAITEERTSLPASSYWNGT